METAKPKLTWKTVVFPLVGLIGFFLYIYLFQVDILGIFETAKSVNPLIYSAAILLGFLDVLFFTVSWRELTNFLQIKMSLFRGFLYVWYGIYVDTLVPAESISGEVTRTYLLMRDKCGSCGKIVASMFAHRLLGMAMNVIALTLGIVLLYFAGQVSPLVFNLIVVVAVAITGIMAFLVVLSFRRRWTMKLIEWTAILAGKVTFGRWKPDRLKEHAIGVLANFHNAMQEFKNTPKPVGLSFLYLALAWLFSLSVPYLVFLSLGNPVSWSMILVTSSIVLAVKATPIGIPFEVGLPEAVMSTLYISMGVPAALSATATILVRIITLWIRFFAGFAAQQWLELRPAKSSAVDIEKTKNKFESN
jgi:uncharacterized protein (TIRG00374 family)